MKKLFLPFTLVAILGLGAACAVDTTEPIPQAQAGEVTPDPATDSGSDSTEATVTTTKKAAPAKTVSTCDAVREALLTGTQTQIDAAMAALKADTTADGTAREYADYYLNRDKTDPSMREMDVSLIRMSC